MYHIITGNVFLLLQTAKMGRGWAGTLLVLALVTSSRAEGQGEEERWSRQATAERRQGDWVPLSCANCRPVDQSPLGSDSLPSVLTPPPRADDARLLPPPPPDGLLQQAASGFFQAYNQQQRKPHQQFLTETSAQSINRPQAQFPQKPFFPEPSLDFQPPQQSNRQPQHLQFNQQQIPESNPYLNQPLLLGPQFLSAPFFPPTSFPQNIQPINPAPIQPLAPISPVNFPLNKDNFQVSPDRPEFVQKITVGNNIPPSAPHQEPQQPQNVVHGASQANIPQQELTKTQLSQLKYNVNQTDEQKNEGDGEEVQLLYVPVETLNQRARNLGRQQSLNTNYQGITSHQQETTGIETNKFTSSGKDHEYSTRKPHIEDQESFNTQTQVSKHQYNPQQNFQFQQQQPPVDQEKFNSQTHAVRQQFVKQSSQFQQPALESSQSAKQDIQSTKEQYNFKQFNQQPQLPQVNFNPELQTEQIGNFQLQSSAEVPGNFRINSQNINQEYNNQYSQEIQQNENNAQGLRINQQFTNQHNINNLQQQLPPLEQSNFNSFHQQDFKSNVNTQTPQVQINQPTESVLKEQPYVNQPIHFDHQLQPQQPISQQQSQQPLTQQQHQQQQQYSFPETSQPTVSQVTPTRAPDAYTTQQSKRQRFRNSQQKAQLHDSTRNIQPPQNSQSHRIFPQDYQQTTTSNLNVPIDPTTTEVTTHISNPRQSWRNHQHSNNQQVHQQGNQEHHEKERLNNFQSDHFQVSNSPPTSTSSLPTIPTTPAPNQPPLSVYMETNGDSMINDVLRLLKNAKTIQVLDTVGPDSPQVFVGPSNLKAPTGYIKFELPYLNTLENNRVERKVDKLPFFVAPLNFNPPPGYSKIPFPAPHVGSVVVSNVTVLQTALHEKTYVHEPVTVPSSSERYLDQYTLPAEISPISPQLPSLINSLQDDLYYGSSSTTSAPTTLPETTTYQYRSRGSSRGSQRGSLDYQTSPSPTRRPQSRTRRPWDGRPQSRRQPITTPSTTIEPSTEVSVQQFTPQPEQLTFNSESYNFQNTASPTHIQPENNQHRVENSAAFYENHSVGNDYNQGQLAPNSFQVEQPSQPLKTQNIQHEISSINNQNVQQYYENPQLTQEAYQPVQETAHTTTVPSVTSPNVLQEEYTFKTQRTSGSRRDSSRPHQRFRGRHRLTTSTTTENYEEPDTPVRNQYNQQIVTEGNYQTVPSRNRPRTHNQQRLVENTHFQANVPVNRYNIQTERVDVGQQTTEKLFPTNNNEQLIQSTFTKDNLNTPLISGHEIHQSSSHNNKFQQPLFNPSQPNINVTQNHQDFINVQFSQENNQGQYNVDQVQGISQGQFVTQDPLQANLQQQYQQPIDQTPPHIQQQFFNQQAQQEHVVADSQGTQTNFNNLNLDSRLAGQVYNQDQQNYFESSTQQIQQGVQIPSEKHSQAKAIHQYSNDQSQFSSPKENFRDSSNTHFNLQGQEISTTNNFEQVADVTSTSPQGIVVQTQQPPTPNYQTGNEPEIPHNQQRLSKHNKPYSRTPVETDTSFNEEHTRRGQHHYQSSEDNSETSSTEATTRSSLVRVRGRVRGRQRVSNRNHHTTTEAPNYPTTYLSRQRNNQEKEEAQEYTTRKRVNYSSRQPYNSLRSTKDVLSDQSITEKNYGISEKPSTPERHQEYSVTATTTTTTEAPTTKVMRRYQHILNRNKVRRTRPTDSPSTSGSSGSAKFLVPTTPPPVTRLPSTRGRIRKPVNIKSTTSTTEYPQVNSKWNEKDTFVPSAGSNEILEPLYQTRDKPQQSFGFQQTPTLQTILQKTTSKPIVAPAVNEDDYWNQGVTIQQSTSFDFKPDFAAVTPPSFQTENSKFQGTFSPIWNGQIELQDGNYYDVFRQQQIAKNANDQTPFSSDQQKVVYQEIKSRFPIGKEDQYNEKTHEVSPVESDDFPRERVYPVYREIIKPAETIQDETSQIFSEAYEGEGKNVHEKDSYTDVEKTKSNEELANTEVESESKDGQIKRKIFATQPVKKVCGSKIVTTIN